MIGLAKSIAVDEGPRGDQRQRALPRLGAPRWATSRWTSSPSARASAGRGRTGPQPSLCGCGGRPSPVRSWSALCSWRATAACTCRGRRSWPTAEAWRSTGVGGLRRVRGEPSELRPHGEDSVRDRGGLGHRPSLAAGLAAEGASVVVADVSREARRRGGSRILDRRPGLLGTELEWRSSQVATARDAALEAFGIASLPRQQRRTRPHVGARRFDEDEWDLRARHEPRVCTFVPGRRHGDQRRTGGAT